MKEIKTEDYQMNYNPATGVVTCKGSFRLAGVEQYAPIVEILNEAGNGANREVTLDLRDLQFLNSSGINVISKFVISVRQKSNLKLKVLGSKSIPWQGKSLLNLQRLMPSLVLEMV